MRRMDTQTEAIGCRAILKKPGSPDISVELLRNDDGTFSFTENVETRGTIWPKHSPQQLKSGDTPRMTLDEAWRSLLAKYPDYEATALEDGFAN
jgi:hypothetical protein